MMSIKSWITVLLFCACPVGAVWSADIDVLPGEGTLAAAIAAASPGDTLLLRFGAYSGGAITLNKSLTIRSYKRSDPVISGSGDFTIQGAGISVTLQGLTFEKTVRVNQAAEVRLLENTFVPTLYLENYKSSEGDGSLFIIGNYFLNGAISGISSNDAYIAGNVINNGFINGSAPVWIVGNDVICNCNTAHLIYISSSGTVRIIGNRVRNYIYNNYSYSYGIYASSPQALISGNIVQIFVNPNNAYLDYSAGIHSASGTAATIINNVISGGTKRNTGISLSVSSAKVYGNIIENFNTAITVNSSTYLADIGHNICFNNGTNNCNSANGNLAVDPKFVDRTNFRLAADSPAINAGPPDNTFADLDRTRNDIGAHGGPWSIGQYDIQRSTDNRAPYVYPLFDINSSLSGSDLRIRALGVARMR